MLVSLYIEKNYYYKYKIQKLTLRDTATYITLLH